MKLVVLTSAFCLLTLTSGCDWFTTREPEEPTGGSKVEWEFPSSPRIVVDNLEVSVGQQSVRNYMLTFSAEDGENVEFTFIPDPQTEANNPAKFESWSLEQERNHVTSLFEKLPEDSLVLFIDRNWELVVLGDSADLSAEYELNIGQVGDIASRLMAGYLDFALKRSKDGGWYVTHWQDKRTIEPYCWSDLKAQF